MTNPLNPLEWLRSAQDWFSKTERSSGFRPYLIFCFLVFGLAIVLLALFPETPYVSEVALGLLGTTVLGFVVLYFLKAFLDPEFCRSESHIERLKQMEVEQLGSESVRIDAAIVEVQMLTEAEPEKRLPDSPPGGGEGPDQ